jgi:radical SAM protein with 4Fe4S-binding SPASM domain
MIKKSAILKKQFYSLLDELNHMRIFSLQLSGGEPFTRDDMPELLRYARRINQDWLLKLATNGTLVDEEIADLLKEIKVDLVSVSIDGLDQIHNDFRKMHKSFQMTVDGIKLLIQRGLYVLVNTVIHRENLGQFEAIVKYVYDEVKPSGHRMSIIYPAGRGADDPRQFFKFDEHEDIWTRYMKLKEQYTYLELRMPFLDLPKKIDNHDFTYLKGCVAGKSHCSIQACGDVSPCKLSLYHRAGNIYDQTLHAIWRGSGFEPFRGFNSNDIHDDKCRQCRYLDLCRGGCRVVASQLTGDFHARDPWCEVDLKQLNFVAL